MSLIRLYLDEDVNPILAEQLQARGYDAVTALQAGRQGFPDHDQLLFAAAEGRCLLTHNRDHFLTLVREWALREMVHRGVLIAGQWPFPVLLRRVLRTLSEHSAEEVANLVLWVR